jgi:mannose-6-phosphate isomerase-like protein (cupin superfamily)
MEGEADLSVGDETQHVMVGDIVPIPANAFHKIRCLANKRLLWIALWWNERERP